MKVIGISPLDKDATVALVEDGRIVFAAGEERYSRLKQQDGFPALSLAAGLEYAGWSLDDVDLVVYPFLEADKEEEKFDANLAEENRFLDSYEPQALDELLAAADARVPERTETVHGLDNPNEKLEKSILHKVFYSLAAKQPSLSKRFAKAGSRQWQEEARTSHRRWQSELESGLRKAGYSGAVRRLEHHASHAANSYYASGFNRALCITLDGYGTGLAGSVSLAEDGKIKRLHGVSYPNSLGTMYEHVTSSLGYKPGRHEGKIVGLAAFGDPAVLADVLLSRIDQHGGDFGIYQSNNIYFSRYLAARYPKIDVAAAYQYVLEVVAKDFVAHWVRETGVDAVVLSGGVTANVKLNQRIFEIPEVKEIFVYPNMGDGGCGTGAAMHFSWPGGTLPSITNSYYGPDYSDEDIESALNDAKLSFDQPENYAATVAALIHEGNVVARFDGRMEYGPRALGNRSIMYHAREPEVNQWLNKRLGRTEFMPFAPVTLYEAAEECYLNIEGAKHTAEFMTITFDCSEQMKRDCPAAVHVDGTARPQLIRREVNQGYYDILKEYENLSGISSLINTSFNMHEEPIVRSPADAIRAFLAGGIEWLAIGPYLVEHPDRGDKPAGH
ncbi:carbamoyltransferase family protein [Congregibacter litoralis]|uniref:Putative carbamoyl transferase, NodU family n=1 Tax=Congregibacter litoralis KT71 TaxID=314285 RepID=A4A540_9GAMM|nr:carbamoyltransferase C-terminal domain-containing protein [Congregibacter litoralis]EAQ98911.1 putative carbamoyl transferase, NodU family [Congregibacter litoralis KT71]